MRVVTLLPAATQIVAALGEAGSLVGISHECDYPAHVLGLPRVTATPIDPGASGSAIDAEVRRLHAAGQHVTRAGAGPARARRESSTGWRRSCNLRRRCSRCLGGRSRES